MGLGVLVLGLVMFLGVHSLTMARGVRTGIVERVGEGPYKALYALLGLLGSSLMRARAMTRCPGPGLAPSHAPG